MYRVWWRLSFEPGGRDLKMDQHVVFQARTAGDISSYQRDLDLTNDMPPEQNAFSEHILPTRCSFLTQDHSKHVQCCGTGKERYTRYAKLAVKCEATDAVRKST
jgi:hypothetical protein